MEFAHPHLLWLILPAIGFLIWTSRVSMHPMSPARKRSLLVVRIAAAIVALLALSNPAWQLQTRDEAVVIVVDHSESLGPEGVAKSLELANNLEKIFPEQTKIGIVSAGETATVLRTPEDNRIPVEPNPELRKNDGSQTDLSAAIDLARGLLPSGSGRRLVLITDGVETKGSMERAAEDAAASNVRIDVLPIAGESREDARIASFRPSRNRSHEGAAVELTADIESSIGGAATVKLYENGIEVANQPVNLEAGKASTVTFRRTPEQKNLYTYRTRLEGLPNDTLPGNNEAITVVDVSGRPLILHVEGEPNEARYLRDAMATEGIRLDSRPAEAIPETVQELGAYDAIILSDVPARSISEKSMNAIHDYVEKLGGGLVMIGGMNSFGVGGYYRTPIEEILPVKIKAPEQEEKQTVALALVLDRSGSMQGAKLEQCKSAALATSELLGKQDYLSVTAFDSEAHIIIPIAKLGEISSLATRIGGIDCGGGTSIYPGMVAAHQALSSVKAKVKHLIVLTDGQSEGGGFQALAALMKTEGITTSTVGVGDGADIGLLQQIAAAGGGQCYSDTNPASVTRIFTQDAMRHLGRLIREEPFVPVLSEDNPLIKGWTDSPQLMGYVKTTRKSNAQFPLVTDLNDPLLATWRFGLGKVTAFTSDSKSRWAALWIAGWPGYSQFWGQILRETARQSDDGAMELRLEEKGDSVRIVCELMQSAAEFENNAQVDASIFHLPANALGSGMRELGEKTLRQTGPGRYEAEFLPEESGVFLFRVRAGSRVVSASLARQVSSEAATGQVNRAGLEKIAKMTGGVVLTDANTPLPKAEAARLRFVDLVRPLLVLLLILFAADLCIRRWENLLGMKEAILRR